MFVRKNKIVSKLNSVKFHETHFNFVLGHGENILRYVNPTIVKNLEKWKLLVRIANLAWSHNFWAVYNPGKMSR
jgi:hypothetical protein